MNVNELKHLRELLDERQQAHDRHHVAEQHALQLQAVEYERRLSELNHAHEERMQREQHFVSREIFDAALREIEGRIKPLEAQGSRQAGGLGALVAAVGVGAGIVGIVAFVTR